MVMAWMEMPVLLPAFLASVQRTSWIRKVPPERWARSYGMTSVSESVSAQPQIEPLLNLRFP
jgi:hypothetical protein